MGLFKLGRPRHDPNSERRAEVIALVRATLGLGEHDAVTVSEIACGDPGCGGAETVVLVMRAGQRTRAVKARKALALVTDDEVVAALDGLI